MQSSLPGRLTIHQAQKTQAENSLSAQFAADVRAGLTATPKALAPKYFYDELGSYLFEAICHLPEYYLTKAEAEILQRYSAAIIRRLPGKISLVELGSGSSIKTRSLIEAILHSQSQLRYQPIDISAAILEESAQELLKQYPALSIAAQAADYTQGLNLIGREKGEQLLVLFLGSNIGNYDPESAQKLLLQIRKVLCAGDGLLIGADLKKSPAILEAAYDDPVGVTAAFNLNLLARINRELGGNFNLKQFAHRAFYNSAASRIEMHLVSRIAQCVKIKSLNLNISFDAGETIHTENSYKYDLLQLSDLASKTGFKADQVWLDSGERFSCNLWLVE
ncbi:MAG TPA: L-histidine N(alpha)-methyltransferase [Blastocatellia bacterium]|nr:L-histidine N(alpha)-methyltransferase [Blastocatellia bacterium]